MFFDDELKDEQPPDNVVIVEGVVKKVGFHPERLESYRAEVIELLSQLPESFNEKPDGGWSFLQAHMTNEGVHWGEHHDVEALLLLGLGLGLVGYLLPREFWNTMPGGMPYFMIKAPA